MVPAKKRVLLDCDGVLSDFLTSALQVINTSAKTDFKHHEVTEFDICQSLGVPHEWPTLRAACGEKDFCINMGLVPGAVAGVEALREKADIFCVTSPMSVPNWVVDRNIWLEKHFGITKAFIVHTEAKHIVTGDVFVDDKVENVKIWAEYNPKNLAILFDASYNQNANISLPNVARGHGWDGVLHLANHWLHPNMLPLDKATHHVSPLNNRRKW
jgi:5'(3')-deoxyribonucleotidase